MTNKGRGSFAGRGPAKDLVKMHYFFINLRYSQAQIRQIESIVMMTKKKTTKTVNFMTPRGTMMGAWPFFEKGNISPPLLAYTRA